MRFAAEMSIPFLTSYLRFLSLPFQLYFLRFMSETDKGAGQGIFLVIRFFWHFYKGTLVILHLVIIPRYWLLHSGRKGKGGFAYGGNGGS